MSNTKVEPVETKVDLAAAPPPYVVSTPSTGVVVAQIDQTSATVWYVLSILATIFCCLPCGVIGLVHTMIGKHEGERGNLQTYRRRMTQAKCWTSWSIGLGLALLIMVVIYWAVVMRMYNSDHHERDGMKDMKL